MSQNLLQLHQLVKEHPFRINNDKKYLSNYVDIYYKFYKEFEKEYPYESNNKQRCGLSYMLHDTSKAISNVKNKGDYSQWEIQILETGLSALHLYMDYGICPNYYRVWYDRTLDHYNWNEKYQKYFIKFYDKNKYAERAKWYKNHWKDCMDSKEIREVVEEICSELQFTYDHYDELFGYDIQNTGKEKQDD